VAIEARLCNEDPDYLSLILCHGSSISH
jgi:hypothetical protein